MNSTKPSKLRLRTILILTHLSVSSLSAAVTLAILNVHPGVGLFLLLFSMGCILYIIQNMNKQYLFRKLGTLYFTRKDGKFSIEYLKPRAIDLQDSTKEQDQVKW